MVPTVRVWQQQHTSPLPLPLPSTGIKRKRQQLTSGLGAGGQRRKTETSKHGKSFLPVTASQRPVLLSKILTSICHRGIQASSPPSLPQPNWVLILYHVSHSHSSAAINFKREADTQPLKEERNLKYLMSNKALKLTIVCLRPTYSLSHFHIFRKLFVKIIPINSRNRSCFHSSVGLVDVMLLVGFSPAD